MALKTHECAQADELLLLKTQVSNLNTQNAKFESKLDSLYKTVEGNGQKGMKELVTRIDERVSSFAESQSKLENTLTNIHGTLTELSSYKITQEALIAQQKLRKNNVKWLIRLVITTLIALFTLFIEIRSLKKDVEKQSTELNELKTD